MTSLAAGLEALDDHALVALLEARPDLLNPPSRTFVDLAARAGRGPSVSLALRRLDRFSILVLEGLSLPGMRASAVPRVLHATEGEVGAAIDRLVGLGLAWRGDGDEFATPNIASVLNHPLLGLGPLAQQGLGVHQLDALRAIAGRLGVAADGSKRELLVRLAAHLADPVSLTRVLASLPREAVALLREVDGQLVPGIRMPWGWNPGRLHTPADQLASRGLVLPATWEMWLIPAEVSIHLRNGLFVRAVPASEPVIRTVAAGSQQVAAAAAEAGTLLLRQIAELLDELDVRPAAALKQGGVGVQQTRRLAKRLGCDEGRVLLVLEAAYVGGLIGYLTADEVRPTALADDWLAADAAERWVTIAEAWMATGRYISLAGHRSTDDKPIPALLGHQPGADDGRRVVLGAVLLGSGESAARVDDLVAALAWRWPSRFADAPASVETVLRWVVAEGVAVGVLASIPDTAHVAPAPLAALLAEGLHDKAVLVARADLPAVVEQFLVQADFTVIVPGEPSPSLARFLADIADRESAGAASVWRISEPSVTRALDLGRTAAEIIDLLGAHATHTVPQPVAYLIGDVGRRHGRVRVGPSTVVVYGEDPTLLAEVLAHRRCAALKLRAIAPTVLVSSVPLARVVDGLRSAGFLPAVEDESGCLVVGRPPAVRATPAPARALRPAPRTTTADAQAAVGRLRSTAASVPTLPMATLPIREPGRQLPLPPTDLATTNGSNSATSLVSVEFEDPQAIREALAVAIEVGAIVEMVYVNGQGRESVIETVPLDLGDHGVIAMGRTGQQTYLLSGIRSLALLDDGEDEDDLADQRGDGVERW